MSLTRTREASFIKLSYEKSKWKEGSWKKKRDDNVGNSYDEKTIWRLKRSLAIFYKKLRIK